MKLNEKWGWFLGFTAVFAALAAYVFWGTWSPDFAPVMPDDNIWHHQSWAVVWNEWLRKFFTTGKVVPSDLLWEGLLLPPDYVQELKYAAAGYFAALGLAYFLRGRGLSRLAAYGAGLLLAFSGYWFSLFSAGHGGWFVWMTYGIFAFGLIDRALGKGKVRHWLGLGAVLAWGSFYQPDLWLLFTVFTAVYFVFAAVRERKFPSWKGMALAAAAFFLIGAPSFRTAIFSDLKGRDEQIASGETTGGRKEGESPADAAARRWEFVTNWSLPSDETVEFVSPRANGDTSCPLTLALSRKRGSGIRPYTGALGRPLNASGGNYRQHSLYVGVITCILALLGALCGISGFFNRTIEQSEQSNNRTIVFFFVAALLCWLFSLGRYCEPVYRLVYALPFGDYLRAPVKWHHLTEFCLVVLAGYGIDGLRGSRWLSGLRGGLSGLVVAVVVLLGAVDLARIDRLYCAPIDMRAARQQNASGQITFLRKQDFAHPQVKELLKKGLVVSLAYHPYAPDVYLVEVLTPRKPYQPKPLPPVSLPNILGLISLLTGMGVFVFALCERKVG